MTVYQTISVFSSATGSVVRVCTLPEDHINDNILPSEDFVVGVVDGQVYYIDLDTKQPTAYPAKPSIYHQFDFAAKQWVDNRTLAMVKDMAWGSTKALRTQKEAAGFTWDGSVLDSDQVSQQRIMGAVQLAGMNPAFTIPWTLQNNTVRTLNAAEMMAVGAALGAHVAAIFARAQELRLEIYAATTIADVEAITWDAP